MTPAITYLKSLKLPFDILSYEHEPQSPAFGLEAAEKLMLPPQQVFKTLLVALNTGTLVCVLVPVAKKLDMKAIAKHMRVKSAKMAEPEQVKNSSGYVLGGVSPFGQKKVLKSIVDDSALGFKQVYVSAGKRGLELKIAPDVFTRALSAEFIAVAKDN